MHLHFVVGRVVFDHLLASERRAGEILRIIDGAMEVSPESEKRNSYIRANGQATNLRKYVHRVQGIRFGESGIVDREMSQNTMNALCLIEIESTVLALLCRR